MYSEISGAIDFFDIPARSLSKTKSAFNINAIFLIIAGFGAERLFFSISLRYDGAIPIFLIVLFGQFHFLL